MAAMLFCVLLQVFDRYLLTLGAVWSEELDRLLLLAVGAVGMVQAFKSGTHFRMSLLQHALPAAGARLQRRLVTVLTVLFLLLFAVSGLDYCRTLAATVSPSLGLSLAAPSLILPAAALTAAWGLLWRLRRRSGAR